MITETAQILSAAHHELKTATIDTTLIYKLGHKNNPCSNWAKRSLSNYRWLISLGLALGEEYTKRYNKTHKSETVLNYLKLIEPNIADIGVTKFVMVMPDEFISNDNPVLSYRVFYNKDKARFAKWKKGNTPYWFKNEIIHE